MTESIKEYLDSYKIPPRPARTVDAPGVAGYIERRLLHAVNVAACVAAAEFFGDRQWMVSDPNPFPKFKLWGRR